MSIRSQAAVRTEVSEGIDYVDIKVDPSNSSETSSETLADTNIDAKLTWRTWIVVFISCFAQLAQVFVIAGTGQNIAFISRDLATTKNANLAGWIIQGPLLVQSVVSPIIGRLSDVLDRKWLVTLLPLIACIGAAVSATASSMLTLIGGGILIGFTLSTISIVQTIPSEVLPNRYRALANGAGFIGSGIGGVLGSLGAGKVTSLSSSGWRNIYWMQVGLHGLTALAFLSLYNPPKRSHVKRLVSRSTFWAIDPIGCGFFILGTTLVLLALNFVKVYDWSHGHVVAPMTVGIVCLICFGLYEWKGRSDGLVAHAYFTKSATFALSLFALTVEGWIFYSAVNTVVPSLTLRLGFEDNAWSISVRQLSSSLTTLVACIPFTWYATKYKDMKSPLLVSFSIFLAATICYALISPDLNKAQIGYNVLVAFGQAGPLTLLVALIQLSVPHDHLSTATGLAFSARAIGGAFGNAVLTAIVDSKLTSSFADEVTAAALGAGLPRSSVDLVVTALQNSRISSLQSVPGIDQGIITQCVNASRRVYAQAYRLAWSSIIPFVVLALVAVACTKEVKSSMTERIEASVEPIREKTADSERLGGTVVREHD